MIDEARTLELFGYTSDTLSKGSHKKIVVSCEICGEKRVTSPRAITSRAATTSLYKQCSQKDGKHAGDKNGNWGGGSVKLVCQECGDKYYVPPHRETISNFCSKECHHIYHAGHCQGVYNPMHGKQHSEESRIKNSCSNQRVERGKWKGFSPIVREYATKPAQCTKLNEPFTECEGHHLSRSLLVFIPRELHNHVRHNLKTGEGMAAMNALALQFLNSAHNEHTW